MTAVGNRPPALAATRPARRPLGSLARAYVALTKPRIIELLLVTTVPPMFLAARGVPRLDLVAATLVAGTLAAGSANALNNYVDRDIDLVMRRTARRPLATAVIRPGEALGFGVTVGVVATLAMALLVNVLAAGLTLFAILFYVFGYTLGLKRRTAQNIVWGGAAGCMPVLIGWAAVTGSLAWPAWALFGVVFFWTPPHFWALAMRFRADYAAAGVPMLPVVATQSQVARQIVGYSWLMVLTSLTIVPVTGWAYLVAALVVGGLFLREAHRLARAARAGVDGRPMRLFHWSTTYLTLLFVAVALAPLLPF